MYRSPPPIDPVAQAEAHLRWLLTPLAERRRLWEMYRQERRSAVASEPLAYATPSGTPLTLWRMRDPVNHNLAVCTVIDTDAGCTLALVFQRGDTSYLESTASSEGAMLLAAPWAARLAHDGWIDLDDGGCP